MSSDRERKTRRCAIYTRKSTDEGLEQSFNSLDAQREACAAYILSQAHEGWVLHPEFYDDGGYSGGSIDRPGLRQLLDDVAAGRIDIIVVYKVDRLTRSLADFARIVDILDKQGASFVSVTQAFNTTNSMGRLTLNVLLSFAQFEREVTGERIRDKIAASKARGMWMGGVVPLGYEVRDRKLIVVPHEAERVRHIFERYRALGSTYLLQTELAKDGILTKARVLSDGRPYGGVGFSRGALYQMLRNRIYLGEVAHRGNVYAGEHEAILDRELFEAVNRQLNENRRGRGRPPLEAKHPSLLAGLIWDSDGRRMTPVHANKGGVRYRYYISRKDKERLDLPIVRVPAAELEGLVLGEVGERLDRDWTNAPPDRERLAAVVQKITVCPDRIDVVLAEAEETLSIPAQLISRSGERLLASPGKLLESSRRDRSLIKLIVRAHQARRILTDSSVGSAEAAAAKLKVSLAYFASLLRIAHLAPDITVTILEGRQPVHLNRQHLARVNNLPVGWVAQREMLGFSDP
jgi:site-specific DNA recombinase